MQFAELPSVELKQAILSRHAVRSYCRRRVDEQAIRLLLEAAVHAPSAKNEQPWSFVVVQDRAQLERYSDLAKAAALQRLRGPGETPENVLLLRNEAFNIFYDAGTLIVICASENSRNAAADCWLAAQNLMLTAHDLGLGACPIGLSISVLNSPEIKAELHIPERSTAVAPIVVGYPEGPTTAPMLRDAPRILYWHH